MQRGNEKGKSPERTLAGHCSKGQKCFYKYFSNKKRAKEHLHSSLDVGGSVANKNEEKTEVLNAFFASVFNSQTQTGYSQGSQPPVLEDREAEQNKPPTIQEEAVNDLLCHLDTYTSVGPNGIHLRELREQRSWSRHSPSSISSPG